MYPFKAHKPDGTEGTATLEMTYREGNRKVTIEIFGCIVKNDSNLNNFIRNDYKKGANLKKFATTNYYFYTCDYHYREFAEKSIIETTIHLHRFSKPNNEKTTKLNYSPLHVVKVQEHIFLLCDCDYFNKSQFLKEYSKELQVPESLDAVIKNQNIHGLIVTEGKPKFIPLTLKCHQSSSTNVFAVDPECYKQLKDAGPILLQDEKKVVGSYIKSSDDNRIAISVFGHVQEEDVKNKSEKPEVCKNEQEPQARSILQEPGPSGIGVEDSSVKPDENEPERTKEIVDEQTKKKEEPEVEMVKTTGPVDQDWFTSETESTKNSLEEDGRRKKSEKTEGCKQGQQDPQAQSSLQDRIPGPSEIGVEDLTVRSDENEPERAQEGIVGEGTNKEDEMAKTTGPAGESHGKDQFSETDSTRKEFSSLADTCDTGYYSSFQSVVNDENYCQAKSLSTVSVHPTKMKAEEHSTQSSAQENESMSDEWNYSQSEPSSIPSVHSTQKKAEEHSLRMQSHNQDNERKNLSKYSGSGEMEFEPKQATVEKEEKLEQKREKKILEEAAASQRYLHVKHKIEQEHDDETDNNLAFKDINPFLNDDKSVKTTQHKTTEMLVKVPSSNTICHTSDSTSPQEFTHKGHQQDCNSTRGKDSPKHPVEKDHSSGEILAPYPQQVSNPGPEASRDPLEEIKLYLPDGPDQLKDNLRRGKNKQRYRKYLLHVSKKAVGNWQEVGRQLGIEGNVLRRLSEDHSAGGSREQTYQMLVYWMNSDKNPTPKRLLTALVDAELAEVANDISDVLTKEHYKSRGGKPVTEALLNRITKDIKDVWKFLGRYLGIDENTIHSIAMDNRDKTREQAHQMLMKWKQSNASRATSQVLINALEDVGKTNVAIAVQEWEKI